MPFPFNIISGSIGIIQTVNRQPSTVNRQPSTVNIIPMLPELI
jgi:hypothetical protein